MVIGIIVFIFFLFVLEQYMKDEKERDRKKTEAESRQKLEDQRLQKLQQEKDHIALEAYKVKLIEQSDLETAGLNKDQIILWGLVIAIVALVVFMIIWFI